MQELKRSKMLTIVEQVHNDHPSHGYRWVSAYIRINFRVSFSDSYIYKAFRYLNIQSQTKHKSHNKPRKEKDRYPNLIFATWETVDRPRQVIVSDMTAFHILWFYFELTMYFDVFTKQILSWQVTFRKGAREQYIDGLHEVMGLLDGCADPVVVHTDQGSVYASVAYNKLIKDKNILRSMSRAGKPTDNPVNESLNGWIKEELIMDFHLDKCRDQEAIRATLARYVEFYNHKRPCFAIGYDTPDHYFKRFINHEIEKKDTFSRRVISEVPKFVQKRKSTSENESFNNRDDASTFENEKNK